MNNYKNKDRMEKYNNMKIKGTVTEFSRIDKYPLLEIDTDDFRDFKIDSILKNNTIL